MILMWTRIAPRTKRHIGRLAFLVGMPESWPGTWRSQLSQEPPTDVFSLLLSRRLDSKVQSHLYVYVHIHETERKERQIQANFLKFSSLQIFLYSPLFPPFFCIFFSSIFLSVCPRSWFPLFFLSDFSRSHMYTYIYIYICIKTVQRRQSCFL